MANSRLQLIVLLLDIVKISQRMDSFCVNPWRRLGGLSRVLNVSEGDERAFGSANTIGMPKIKEPKAMMLKKCL